MLSQTAHLVDTDGCSTTVSVAIAAARRKCTLASRTSLCVITAEYLVASVPPLATHMPTLTLASKFKSLSWKVLSGGNRVLVEAAAVDCEPRPTKIPKSQHPCVTILPATVADMLPPCACLPFGDGFGQEIGRMTGPISLQCILCIDFKRTLNRADHTHISAACFMFISILFSRLRLDLFTIGILSVLLASLLRSFHPFMPSYPAF